MKQTINTTIKVELTTEELVEILRGHLKVDKHVVIDVTIVNTDNIKIVGNSTKDDGLWYPDDSGEWVEVRPSSTYTPEGLVEGDGFEFLLQRERDSRRIQPRVIYLNEEESWLWGDRGIDTIVAYKKVN